MGINRKITTDKVVLWNGEEAARVRGLSSDDLAIILEREGEGLRTVMDALDDVDLHKVDVKDSNAIAGVLMKAGPSIVVQLFKSLPHFLASVIVVAANGDEEDIQYVAAEWPVALQFLALTEIAVLTFSGAEGFRTFVGNAFALVGLANTLTGAETAKVIGTGEPTPSDSGAIPSSS